MGSELPGVQSTEQKPTGIALWSNWGYAAGFLNSQVEHESQRNSTVLPGQGGFCQEDNSQKVRSHSYMILSCTKPYDVHRALFDLILHYPVKALVGHTPRSTLKGDAGQFKRLPYLGSGRPSFESQLYNLLAAWPEAGRGLQSFWASEFFHFCYMEDNDVCLLRLSENVSTQYSGYWVLLFAIFLLLLWFLKTLRDK